MEVKKVEVVWSKTALHQLHQVFKYISEDSPKNAKLVVNDIVEAADELIEFSERYPKDKLKQNNNGDYRAFELHRIRIAYRITKKHIKIIRVRHTSREPLVY